MTFLLAICAYGLYVAVPLYVQNFGRVFSTETSSLGFVGLLVAIAFAATVGWILATTFKHGGRDPTWLDVDAGGFRLRWDDGCALEWRWSKLRLGITIHDFGDKRPNGAGAEILLRMSLTWAGISQEALSRLLESARVSGLRIRTYDQVSYGFPIKLILIDRVRGESTAPSNSTSNKMG